MYMYIQYENERFNHIHGGKTTKLKPRIYVHTTHGSTRQLSEIRKQLETTIFVCTSHDKIFVLSKRLGDDVTWLQCTCHDEALVLVERLGDEP